MATRLRKLARKLGRSPDEVLGLLHRLGYVRYKSGEDMVADPVITKLHAALKSGMRAQPVPTTANRRAMPPTAQSGSNAAGLMGQLVPGVTPLGERAEGAVRTRPVDASDPLPPTRAPRAAVSEPMPQGGEGSEDPSGAAMRLEWMRAKTALADEQRRRALVEEQCAALNAELKALQALREQEKQSAEERRREAGSALTLRDALAQRGLRGADEMSRAVSGLVAGRHLEGALLDCVLSDDSVMLEVLSSKLMLFDTEPVQGLNGSVGVGVSPDRAEMGSGRALNTLAQEVSEGLLLWGHRQVLVVGADRVWHGWMRTRMDSRLDVRFEPLRNGRLELDLVGIDVLWCWSSEVTDEVQAEWNEQVRCLSVAAESNVLSALSGLVSVLKHE